MPAGNGTGLLSKQSLILYATILAVGGGGAGLVKSSADQGIDIREMERRVDAVEADQKVILQELKHINQAVDSNKETGKEILKLLRDHMDDDK